MATVQIITSPSGDELVVVPRAEFERLTALAAEADEDAADVAAYDAAVAALGVAGDGGVVIGHVRRLQAWKRDARGMGNGRRWL